MKKFLCAVLAVGVLLLALTACKMGGAPEPSPSPTPAAAPTTEEAFRALLADITPEEIVYVPNPDIVAANLAPLLNDAMDHLTPPQTLTLPGAWAVDFYLSGDGTYSGEDAVHLYAGLEENIVTIISQRYMDVMLFAEQEELYQLIRAIYDGTPGGVDEAAYEELRGVVDGRMKATLEREQGYSAKAGYYGTELLTFQPIETYDDLTPLGPLTVYRISYALLMEHPEYAALAGGEVLDSQCREIGSDGYTFLAVLRENGAVTFTSFLWYEDLYWADNSDAEDRECLAQLLADAGKL